jgi:type II secretory pathway pseudopilin PulG
MRQARTQPASPFASSESDTQPARPSVSPSGTQPARGARPAKPSARGESGFTMIVTLVVLVIASLLMAGAWAAANGDIHLTQTDGNAKKAYYAAQAGISDYIYHLNQDINYWTYCTGGPAASNHALNQEGSTANRVSVPGASEEQYAIQLLHASTSPAGEKCNPAKPLATMIEGGTAFGGTFRIESTGYSGNQQRTIATTFGHKGFLEFIYYTKYETLDPVTYTPVEPKCEAPYKTRPEPPCAQIDFITADHINGPFHTQDNASLCGEPTFGRKPTDNIEFLHGWRASCGGSKPKILGTEVTTNLKSIEPPPSDVTLRNVVEPAYHYLGKTTIVLEGEKMKVTYFEKVGEVLKEVTKENVAFPTNGLIYVSNNGSCSAYTPYGPTYTEDTHCGNVYVKGNYTGQLTIASENDVVINGNITTPVNGEVPSTNAVLGLIADNFVRIYHPLTGARPKELGECNSTSNAAGTMTNVTIYAAILAVNHSFIVDNFDCGAALEKLSVYGAIAQIFRGTVGMHSGETVVHGYAKNYNYDDRLTIESPPDFLSPVAAAWIVKRETLG